MGRLAKPGDVPDGATLIGPTVVLQSDSEALSQHSYGVKQEATSQSNWRHNKAANEGIPGSLHK
ncbi:hypothetical protein BFG07_03090 [Kosakonia cowanii]|nr:hypothetical protein BFG07_03090 [Kosakonia cowanii]